MVENRINPEIVVGAKVFISILLGVAEGEATALAASRGIQAVRTVNAKTLELWSQVGLEIGSEGVIETVYITGYSNVLFNPTKKRRKPFSFAVPTTCLSVK